jgi:hypothetical protein
MSHNHYIGNGNNITLHTTKMVQVSNTLTLKDADVWVELDVNISADLSTIPEKYHEVFSNMITSRYLGRVSYSDNPFSQCHMPPKKWYQFWK